MHAVGSSPRLLYVQSFAQAARTVIGVLDKMCKCAKCAFDFLANVYTTIPSLPILKNVMDVCGDAVMIFRFFNSIDMGIKLKKRAQVIQRNQEKLYRWQQRNVRPEEVNIANVINTNVPDSGISATEANNLKWACDQVAAERRKDYTFHQAARALIDIKCRKLEIKIENLKVRRTRYKLSIACDISEIAVTIMGLAATAGVIVFSTSPLPLLFLALVAASMAVCKKVYKARHKEPLELPELNDLEAKVVAAYKKHKIANKPRTEDP